MRPDMPRVIVDEPRSGLRPKYHRCRERQMLRRDPDLLPPRIGMRRSWWKLSWFLREFGDHVNPLERWLEAQCGRPWDDVRAEISAVAKKKTLRGYHLWVHVEMLVSEKPLIIGSEVKCTQDWLSNPDFFVDPETGRLRRSDRR